MYSLEKDLLQDFISCLPCSPFSAFGPLKLAKEFNYNRGKVDVIALTRYKDIIAFEAKLEKWRVALHQAYRNTCFANYSYVIVPESTAKRAMKHFPEFTDRAVGLCYISDGKLLVAHEAARSEPLQPWLSNRATETLESGEEICERRWT